MKVFSTHKWMLCIFVSLFWFSLNSIAQTTETFNYSGAIETWTVPAGVTSITIETWGAQGGGGANNGGRGAYLKGDFAVSPGDQLKILVGQMGQVSYGYGGGGGSFVATIADVPLIVAGGGGGAEHNNNIPGFDAVLTEDGMSIENASGGTMGNGGGFGDPNTSGCGWPGSGGGGFYGDGGTSGDGGGYSFVNGGAGGTDPSGNCVVAGSGGFGGGGAGGNPGGGGGGYSGGAGGANIGVVPNRGGGGGGSYNAGTNQNNMAGVQTGNGLIKITYIANPCSDNDMDGYTDCDGDCDDNNPNIYPGEAPALTNVTHHNSSSATVYWSTIPGSINYGIRYAVSGSDMWTESTSLRAWRRLFGLSPCTTYDVQFRNFKNGVWNCWSDSFVFTTEGCPMPKSVNQNMDKTADLAISLASVQLYPNPVIGTKETTVEINTQISQNAQWILSDLSGKIIQSGISELTAGFNYFTIQTADLPAGVYFFKAPMAEGVQTVKLIVE